jgi:predicted DNA-binding protein
VGKNELDQVKVHLPKNLKERFAAKVKKESKTQTGVLKSLIHKYLNS